MLTSLVILGMSLGSGIPGVVAALLAPTLGWESVFVVGAVVPIFIAVLLAFLLPESLLFLTNKGRDRAQIAQRVQAMAPTLQLGPQTQFALRGQASQQKAGYLELFSPGLRVTTPLLWVIRDEIGLTGTKALAAKVEETADAIRVARAIDGKAVSLALWDCPGGGGAIGADRLAEAGIALARFSTGTAKAFEAHYPAGQAGNPVDLGARIDELSGQLGGYLGELPIAGLYSLSFDVDRRGAVSGVRALSDTTRVPRALERHRTRAVRRIRDHVAGWTFGAQKAPSRVTLPLVFERG
jgi:MFS family permease